VASNEPGILSLTDGAGQTFQVSQAPLAGTLARDQLSGKNNSSAAMFFAINP
jgi:hypothetical protein